MSMIIVETRCPACGGINQLEVEEEGFSLWRRGQLIQKALPSLNEIEREMLISGLCGRCWHKTFPEDK
jgi:phage FluMu protein Com